MKDELQKHTLNLYSGDFDRLQELFPEIGASIVIRKLIRNYLTSIESKQTSLPPTEVQL